MARPARLRLLLALALAATGGAGAAPPPATTQCPSGSFLMEEVWYGDALYGVAKSVWLAEASDKLCDRLPAHPVVAGWPEADAFQTVINYGGSPEEGGDPYCLTASGIYNFTFELNNPCTGNKTHGFFTVGFSAVFSGNCSETWVATSAPASPPLVFPAEAFPLLSTCPAGFRPANDSEAETVATQLLWQHFVGAPTDVEALRQLAGQHRVSAPDDPQFLYAGAWDSEPFYRPLANSVSRAVDALEPRAFCQSPGFGRIELSNVTACIEENPTEALRPSRRRLLQGVPGIPHIVAQGLVSWACVDAQGKEGPAHRAALLATADFEVVCAPVTKFVVR